MSINAVNEEKLKDWRPESEHADACPICNNTNIAEGNTVIDGGIANGSYLECRTCGAKGPVTLC